MRTFTPDIKINSNEISGRQGLAYVYNSGNIKNIGVDTDAPQPYADSHFFKYGKVKVISKNRDWGVIGKLCWSLDSGYEITGSGACLSASFNFADHFELLEESLVPVIKEDTDIVAITEYSAANETISTKLYKVTHVDYNCMTLATLTPLTDEEMKEVADDARKWSNR